METNVRHPVCASCKQNCNSHTIPSLDALCHLIRTLAEYNEHGKWTQSYIYGNGLLAMNTNTTTEQLLTDGRGSITEAITATGSTTTYRYDAFGNVERAGTSSNPFTSSKERQLRVATQVFGRECKAQTILAFSSSVMLCLL